MAEIKVVNLWCFVKLHRMKKAVKLLKSNGLCEIVNCGEL